MAGITPTVRDANGAQLIGHGTELFTKRITGIDTDGVDIELGVDFKSMTIHVEGSTDVMYMTGTVTGSDEIHLTSDGYTLSDVPMVVDEDGTPFNIAAPSGTIDVSIMAWR
jgi:hypothetical protein